jgi:7-cyano-7-deazaguanine reductase
MKQEDLKRSYEALGGKLRLHAEPEEAVRPDCLIVFPYEYAGREAGVEIDTEEFTCLCPWSGLPDFGRLRLTYVPDRLCLELKSLKYYLTSFRQVGILQEHAASRILDDLVRACRPRRMTVTLDYRVRGGIHTAVTVSHPAPE